MRKLLAVVLVLIVAIGALGYWRGWFEVAREGTIDVHADPAKFKQDPEAFSKTVHEKTQAMKEQIAGLWKKSEGLTASEKAHEQNELGDLKKKQDRLEQQIKDLKDAGQPRFESIKQDLSKSLDEVEKKIEELTTRLEKTKDK